MLPDCYQIFIVRKHIELQHKKVYIICYVTQKKKRVTHTVSDFNEKRGEYEEI